MDYGFGDTAQTGIQTVVDHGMPTAFPQNSFFFQQRRGKLDFKSLSRIDLDRVVEEVRHTLGGRLGSGSKPPVFRSFRVAFMPPALLLLLLVVVARRYCVGAAASCWLRSI
jgi:hypothetical protein